MRRLAFEPGVGALDRPAVAGLRVGGSANRRLAAAPDFVASACRRGSACPRRRRLADPRLDLTFPERLLKLRAMRSRGRPSSSRRLDPAHVERVEERQQVSSLVLVAGCEPDLEWCSVGVYGAGGSGSRVGPGACARPSRPPFSRRPARHRRGSVTSRACPPRPDSACRTRKRPARAARASPTPPAAADRSPRSASRARGRAPRARACP